MNPTDPITPVRALIEAAGKATPEPWKAVALPGNNFWSLYGPEVLIASTKLDPNCLKVTHDRQIADANFMEKARNATASISQLLSEHDKVVALVAEMRKVEKSRWDSVDAHVRGWAEGAQHWADRLQSIVEGK